MGVIFGWAVGRSFAGLAMARRFKVIMAHIASSPYTTIDTFYNSRLHAAPACVVLSWLPSPLAPFHGGTVLNDLTKRFG
ncbi:hypothetical protein EBAPG3_004230 [Nitrosospira lacus]|uniref:Uncharacterized protein n=1 Tax=Nitrosospira lacus TaxID=1288494 RepID=A0A1W6SMN3_9PROT|nr:hypothetical protein EBAPG3_004230 [Nitrosospira lacus]